MSNYFQTAAAAALLTCMAALGAAAARAEHPAGPTCMDITWNEQLLKSFPRAPAACQEVVVRNGKKFARFEAQVTAVRSDTVSVRFLNVGGDPGREITLKPGPDARVKIGGKRVEYSKLQKDDKLTFWVPEREVGVVSDPDEIAASTIILN